ncbi:uncharacterized protein C6orf132 [Mastacembelus armatus]|uniref:uncharacterized protein C6orf132 n=1 Tax=Mastacembelus armatus TaxID=205130 RepID=UPI000E4646A1|nr:uncharacterized protein C6orf132-like [Mastacembelus armatus]
MKRGTLNFLGRKNQSLFDTSIKPKDMDNMEFALDSPAIPESGTASVRARPTVKHHASTDSFQGFAVPTPKVPLLPPVNGPKANGSVSGDRLLNGSVISVPDLVGGEIFVPPPPSMAPPPPPVNFIVPPPDFMGDLNSPPMTPPKPNTNPASSIPPYCSTAVSAPEPPNFTPPQPPTEKQHKTQKTPPPKPIRLSSIPILDSPPQTPAPPPPVQTPTLSSFNPQNTAKLFNGPKTSVLSGYEDHETRPKQMLVLEDSRSVNSTPALVQVDGKAPKVSIPPKPVSKVAQELKESSQITQPPPSPLPEPNKTATVPAQSEIPKLLPPAPQMSPKLLMNSTQVNLEFTKDKFKVSPSQSHKFSPLLDRKLRNLKSSEPSVAREGPAASPLALLMAAKEREKQKLTHTLSQENNPKIHEQPSASIHPSDSSPKSFVVIPASNSPSSLIYQDRTQQGPKSVSLLPSQSTSPAPSRVTPAASPVSPNLAQQKQNIDFEQRTSNLQSAHPGDNKEGLNLPLLPPPPEFDDLDDFMEPPPSIRPPDPPVKKTPPPTVSLTPPAPAPTPPAPAPPPPPKPPAAPHLPPPPPKPPAAPHLPPPNLDVKPKLQPQTKLQVAPAQLPPTLSPSQATLLSILQKKMEEMDHRMPPKTEAESSDEWGSPFSDEENKAPVVPRATPQSKTTPVFNKAATLDMRELEGRVAKKYQETSSMKVPASNGPSKHQYGTTFTVRPGTKNPITLVSKGDS